ncbi:hypothetical protein PILCRDRAFT_480692 [Piloderma croceum F 1598]|uniref:Uncharacterized protein n=1 Tax=Piloderma croceum (strain F 1598) TaxID=765440 RepID=A0A0C3B6U8_PILCF|nr:hypothetical protein PILCRDRAFT_480692 [Piloderma croceum F 1598]
MMKRTDAVLKYVVRDHEMFDFALRGLDQLLEERSNLTSEISTSSDKLLRRYRHIVRNRDTEHNFDIAVSARITSILHVLYPGLFGEQSGDGDQDNPDTVWKIREGEAKASVVNMKFKTSVFCDQNVWADLENEVDSATDFYWPGEEDKLYHNGKVTRLLVEVWTLSIRWSTDITILSTHDRMVCCRRIGNALHVSKVHNCYDVSPSVARFLVAVLLAASKLTNCPTKDAVVFGTPRNPPPTTGSSQLFIGRTLKASNTVMPMPAVITNHFMIPLAVIGSWDNSTPQTLLDKWRSYRNGQGSPKVRRSSLVLLYCLPLTTIPEQHIRTNDGA